MAHEDTEFVPLIVWSGNLQALMDAADQGLHISCNGISLRREERGVRLMISMSDDQKVAAETTFGFRTRSLNVE